MSSLLAAVKAGVRIVDLAFPLDADVPHSGWSPGFRLDKTATHQEDIRDDGLSVCSDRLSMGTHVGTHMDALGHVACGGRLHGSVEVSSDAGLNLGAPLDAESIPPAVRRGVLLDIPHTTGRDVLEPGETVTADDLRRAAREKQLHPGDVVLVRTGWGRNWYHTGKFFDASQGIPGITEDAAAWLAAHGVSIIGSDTPGVEHIDRDTKFTSLPVHRFLLVKQGIHLLEAVDLEELSVLGVHEFLFVVTPLRLRGATGSPVRPLALIS